MKQYNIKGDNLVSVDEEKDLGVTFDSTLNFKKHINIIVKKANSKLGIIYRTFKHLDAKSFLTLYKAFVRPHLETAQWYGIQHIKKNVWK